MAASEQASKQIWRNTLTFSIQICVCERIEIKSFVSCSILIQINIKPILKRPNNGAFGFHSKVILLRLMLPPPLLLLPLFSIKS